MWKWIIENTVYRNVIAKKTVNVTILIINKASATSRPHKYIYLVILCVHIIDTHTHGLAKIVHLKMCIPFEYRFWYISISQMSTHGSLVGHKLTIKSQI